MKLAEKNLSLIKSRFRRRVLLEIAALLLILTGLTKAAESVFINTDTTWRAIGPAGNLEATPIDSVGLSWEAANSGWNNSFLYDDSDGAGWRNSINNGFTYPPNGNSIWVDGNGYNGSTPAYFRKEFTLSGTPTYSLLSLTVDDDAQVYLNGNLVIDDQNGNADDVWHVDVLSSLHAGQNLLAVKAQDSYGGAEGLFMSLNVTMVPEPSSFALIGLGCAGLLVCRRFVRRHAFKS